MEFTYKDDGIHAIRPSEKPTSIMDNIDGTIYHANYLDYLSKCYDSHNGIIVKPDFLWYTILCEIAVIVKEDPETYRSIFTDSDEKKEISVPTGDAVKMPIDSLTEALFKLIPSELGEDNILLKFSTTTDKSTFAFSTALLDAASPFYRYSMYLCGFNKIKVLGNIGDYEKIVSTLNVLKNIFTDTQVEEYILKCNILMENLIANFDNKVFWEGIFYVEKCGSGSEEEVKGWFTEFFATYPRVGYAINFSTHVSNVEYKNLTTDKSFNMSSGLFSSIIEGDYLIPDFGYYINEIPQS